jgi:hypothetical protein
LLRPVRAARPASRPKEKPRVMEAIAVIALFVIAFGVLNLIEFGRVD